jgi:uncharacterized protein YggE
MKTQLRFPNAIGLLAGFFALGAGCQQPQPIVVPLETGAVAAKKGSVTVNATGTVEMIPDFATFSVTFQRTRATEKAAREALHESIVKLSEAAQKFGVRSDDITTTNVGIDPIQQNGPYGTPPEVTGFRARKATTIKVRDLSRLDAVAEALLDISGDIGRISDITLGVEDSQAFEEKARAMAMAHANRKATQLATNANAELGPPLTLSENIGMPRGQVSKEVLFAHLRQGSRSPVGAALKATITVNVSFGLL